ncbi:MAG: four helix bundle protein [bacterium]|nr:four helix bundle protein [bacterium]
MTASLPNNDFIAHSYALEASGIALDIARQIPPPLKSIADQLIRSANSVPANLAEGNGRCGRDRIHHWRIAYASAKDVDSHLRLLGQAGIVDIEMTLSARRRFDRVRAMTWRLIHPK